MRQEPTTRKRKKLSNPELSMRRFARVVDLIAMIAVEIKQKLLEVLSVGFAGLAMILIIAGPLGIKIEALEGESAFKVSLAIGVALLILTYEKIKDIRNGNNK